MDADKYRNDDDSVVQKVGFISSRQAAAVILGKTEIPKLHK